MEITIIVACKKCEFQKIYSPKSLDKGREFTEYNRSLVDESFEDGRGYTGYKKVCAGMGHEPLCCNSYYKIKNEIGSRLFETQASKSHLLYKCLVETYASLGIYPDSNGLLDIDVSFDGSWLTRGHTSHIGLRAVIDVHTGFVIDFHICSNYCRICNGYKSQKQKKN